MAMVFGLWAVGPEKAKPKDGGIYVNTLDTVAPERVLGTILSKYKGSVVVVDLWATWCGPCRMGHSTMAPMKEELKDKNVVFVYLASATSPIGTWRQMIGDISGEHYYLTDRQYGYVLARVFGSQSIPMYGLFGKDGKLVWQHMGYMPSNAELQTLILKALK